MNACCISAHDDAIDELYKVLLPDACQRSYSELELYYCYGCHYTEPTATYRTANTKRITLCQDYAERLWGGDLSKPSTMYDDCGITKYWEADNPIVIPSLEWNNAYEFFAVAKPPFFQDYTIVITSSSTVDCFDFARGLLPNFVLGLIMLALACSFL